MGPFPTQLEEAIARHRQGHLDEAAAVYRDFAQSQSDLAEPWHLLGVIELQMGRFEDAVPFFQECLKRDADHFKCWSNLGAALYQLQRFEDAEDALKKALAIEPAYVEARFNLGNALMALGKLAKAQACFEMVLEDVPQHLKALINLGLVMHKQGRNREAEGYFEQAHTLAPEDFTCLLNLANVRERLNDVAGAKDAIAAALALQPDHPDANLFGAKIDLRLKQPQNALPKIEKALVPPMGGAPDIEAYYIQFQVLDALDRPKEAFAALTKGNAITLEKARAKGVRPERYREKLIQAHQRLDQGPVQPGDGASQPAPVFFVGFPRSGTTLFEQMLSSHPGIVTTNEISPLRNVLSERHLTQPADAIDADEQARLREAFWREADEITGGVDGRLLVDTAPFGIEWLDIAARVFPNAKAVMIVRDPRDVCFSSLMQNFEDTDQLTNFLDVETTGWVYEHLIGLWLRQDGVLDMARMAFRYEDLIADMEGSVRSVLDFVGQEWCDDILAYRDKAREGHVITPSYTQIGEKLHTRSIARWRRYSDVLAPILPRLAPFVEHFGYAP